MHGRTVRNNRLPLTRTRTRRPLRWRTGRNTSDLGPDSPSTLKTTLTSCSGICLTLSSSAFSLCRMWHARGLVLAAITISLPTYGLDCLAMSTPDEAMACCKAMRCHYHKHSGQNAHDCCKTAPHMHSVPSQPVAAPGITSPSLVLGVVSAISSCEAMQSYHYVIARHSHDPPSDAVSILPLRV